MQVLPMQPFKYHGQKPQECFTQIVKDLDSAAALLPMIWDNPATNYGRLTAAAALAMKSRVLLTAADPLYNTDWDNSGSAKWQQHYSRFRRRKQIDCCRLWIYMVLVPKIGPQ
ncbi:MAG: hypothetical protein WDM90_06360 [Ferruginibacter sp.]